LESAETESWRESFTDEHSYDFRLLTLLLGKKIVKTLPRNVVDIYKESLLMRAKSKEDISLDYIDACHQLYDHADK
jgi:hypothetical protein